MASHYEELTSGEMIKLYGCVLNGFSLRGINLRGYDN